MATITVAADRHTAVVNGGWTNPSNAYSTTGDNVYATAASVKSASVTGDFGFPSANVPAGATINAVRYVVEWKMSASVTGGLLGLIARDFGISDSAAEVTQTTTTEAQSTITFVSTPPLIDLNTDGRMEARVRLAKGNTNTAMTGSVDFVRMEIDYTAAVDEPPQIVKPKLTRQAINRASSF